MRRTYMVAYSRNREVQYGYVLSPVGRKQENQSWRVKQNPRHRGL